MVCSSSSSRRNFLYFFLLSALYKITFIKSIDIRVKKKLSNIALKIHPFTTLQFFHLTKFDNCKHILNDFMCQISHRVI